jgi:uncharacterized protein
MKSEAAASNRRDRHRVGLISDTHGLLRPEVLPVFDGVDLIIHAGDVGGAGVLEALSRIAPVEAVYGNVDDIHNPALTRERWVPLNPLTLHVSHGHELGRPSPELVAASYGGDILIFGHTHRAVVQTMVDKHGKERTVVNPGGAGPRRFDLQPSVGLLTISGGTTEVEIIWLQTRS